MLPHVEPIHTSWVSILLDNHRTRIFIISISFQLTWLTLTEHHISPNAYALHVQKLERMILFLTHLGKVKYLET